MTEDNSNVSFVKLCGLVLSVPEERDCIYMRALLRRTEYKSISKPAAVHKVPRVCILTCQW